MKPAPFSYHRPESVADAVAMLASLEDAKILAGGQSLMAMMNFRYLAPEHIVDINRISELAEIREEAWGSASLDDLLEQDDERNATYALLAQTSSHEESESAIQACNACLEALFLRYLKHRENGIRERFANSDPGGTEQLNHLRDELADLRSNRTVPPTLNFSPSPASEIQSAHVNDQNQNSQGASQNEEENSRQGLSRPIV